MPAGDQMMEPYDRVGDPVGGPPGSQQVVLPHHEPGVGHHPEMVDDVARPPAHGGGDPPLRSVPGGDGPQQGVVGRFGGDPRVLPQQVFVLPEQGVRRIQNRGGQPPAHLLRPGGHSGGGGQVLVTGGPAHDGVHDEGRLRVLDAPEPPGPAVVERRQGHVQRRPPPHGRGAAQKAGHHRHGRPAHDDRNRRRPPRPQAPGGGLVDEGLHRRVQLGAGPMQVRVFVQHQHLRPAAAPAQHGRRVAQRRAPVVEAQRRGALLAAAQGVGEPVEGRPALFLQGQVVHPAHRFHQPPQQEGLSEAPPPVHDPQPQPGAGGGDEAGQVGPFVFPVVQARRFLHRLDISIN